MSKKRVKQYLMLLTVIGLVSIASGSGTFASFTAETVNPNNTFATGTLFLHNTAGAGTVCASETAALNTKTCDTLFTNVTIKPGQAQAAYLTLRNAGTLPASGIKFWEPACTESTPAIGTLNGAVTSGNSNGGSIAVTGLNQNVSAGTLVLVTDGTNSQTFTVGANTLSGASSIPVNTINWAHNFANGVKIELDTSAFTSSPNLCGNLEFSITERTAANGGGADAGCAWGAVSGSTCDTTNANYALFGGVSSPGTSAGTASSLTLASGGGSGNAGTGLDPSGERYFKLIVTAPASLGNTAQNDALTFDLHWQITAA